MVQFCRLPSLLPVSGRQRPKALLTAANGPFLFFSLTEASVVGSRYRRGAKGCGGTVAISCPVPGTPTSRPGPRRRPHALVNLLPTSSRRRAHLFCASLARVSSVPPTLCRTVSPTFGSKFIPCGTALLSVIFPDIESLSVCLRHSLVLLDRRNRQGRRALFSLRFP